MDHTICRCGTVVLGLVDCRGSIGWQRQQQKQEQANAKHRHSRGGKYTETRDYTTNHALCAAGELPIYTEHKLAAYRIGRSIPRPAKKNLTPEDGSFASS